VHKDRKTDKKYKKAKRQKDKKTQTQRQTDTKKYRKSIKTFDFSHSKSRGKTKLYCLAAMSEFNIFLMVFIFPPELHKGKFIFTLKKTEL
jgi:hypothetical protein